MLNKEEKKALEILKEIKDVRGIRQDVEGENEDLWALDIVYNLIEKQQKEIEEKNVAINKMSKDISRQLEEIEEKSTIIMAGAEKVKQLEKEIEELKEKNAQLTNYLNDSYYVSADKIREIIEHYNNELEHIKNGEEFENEKPMYYWGKVALENLLEEN